jgi:multidrug resistance efflux pump
MALMLDVQNLVLGGAVEPDKNLLTLIDLSEVDVVAQVHSKRRLRAVKPGQAVRITALAYPDLRVQRAR